MLDRYITPIWVVRVQKKTARSLVGRAAERRWMRAT
jgi:hypothetical protein